MKVLLVSNHHGSLPGGAVAMLARTQELLSSAGHETVEFAIREDTNPPSPWTDYFPATRDLARQPFASRQTGASPYSIAARRRVRRLARETRPDVAHLHNVFGKLTLSIVDALQAEAVPVVLTLHEYKSVCPNGLLHTHDGICHRCLEGGRFWNAVRHRCEGSLYASAIAAAEAYLNHSRDVWKKVSAFVAPSEFLRDVVVSAGLPGDRVHVVTNPADPVETPARRPDDPPLFVFSGRLIPEKGLSTLAEAAARVRSGARIAVFGVGPVAGRLREQVARERLPVDLHGYAPKELIAGYLDRSLACVVPSVWYENCPMTILEAAGRGVAAIASDLGGMTELVAHKETGLRVPPGDAAALASAIDEIADQPEWALELGGAAWERVRERHDPAAHVTSLLHVYDAVS